MSEATETTAPEAAAEASADRRHVKTRQGTVVSAKAEKTVIVRVERRVKHKKYKKYITLRKRYAAHDTIGCEEGDIVIIRETAPISKTKRWRVSRKLEKHA